MPRTFDFLVREQRLYGPRITSLGAEGRRNFRPRDWVEETVSGRFRAEGRAQVEGRSRAEVPWEGRYGKDRWNKSKDRRRRGLPDVPLGGNRKACANDRRPFAAHSPRA